MPSLLTVRRLADCSLYTARSYSSHCHSIENKMVDWIFLSQMFARYVGIPLFFFGVIGNLLNIFIFIAVRTYRNNPCTFYLLASSVAGTMQLLGAIISRIIITGLVMILREPHGSGVNVDNLSSLRMFPCN